MINISASFAAPTHPPIPPCLAFARHLSFPIPLIFAIVLSLSPALYHPLCISFRHSVHFASPPILSRSRALHTDLSLDASPLATYPPGRTAGSQALISGTPTIDFLDPNN